MISTYFGVVHPWLCDAMGHLTTRHYVGMFDDASYHLFAALDANLDEMQKEDRGFADVKSTLEYKGELHSGALIEIRSTLLRLGNKSFTHRHEMYKRSNSQLAATMENTTVAFNLKTRRAVPLFDDFRSASERYLDSHIRGDET